MSKIDLSLPVRPLRDPAINREIKEIKDALRNLPILWGKGSPEGEIKAAIGTIFLRIDGGTGTTFWVKEADDKQSTGWVSK